jgi:predicted phosphodiesterase
MRLAVISDIHGNLPALEAVVHEIREADAVFCLGDVVNYGPWNDECLELLYSLPQMRLVEGNHEALFLGKEPLEHEIPLVQQFYHASVPYFTRRDLIADLPRSFDFEGINFSHTLDGQKIYPDTQIIPERSSFVGHTHHPFDLMREGKRLINPGSVGQNRARLDIACWAWWEPKAAAVTLQRTIYDAAPLLQKMRTLNYPKDCLAYYEGKLKA